MEAYHGSSLVALLVSLLAIGWCATAAAAEGPPAGRYVCFQFGFNAQMIANGVVVDILDGSHYTTEGSNMVGAYRFVPQGAQIIYDSGKLQGLRSWYKSSSSGKAIDVVFNNGKATNTAVCGIIH